MSEQPGLMGEHEAWSTSAPGAAAAGPDPEGPVAAGAGQCWCGSYSLSATSGEIIVVRVVGELDVRTLPLMVAALSADLDRARRT